VFQSQAVATQQPVGSLVVAAHSGDETVELVEQQCVIGTQGRRGLQRIAAGGQWVEVAFQLAGQAQALYFVGEPGGGFGGGLHGGG
jgi:hypothetical protein